MKGSRRKLWRDYGGTVLIAVAVALSIRFFLIEAYRIPTLAMKPTLEPGDIIFVAKSPFGLRTPWSKDALTQGRPPERGEVVLFSPQETPKLDYIKRVIGLPGDTVQIKAGKLLLNGKALPTEFAPKSNCGQEKISENLAHLICSEPPALKDFGPEKIPLGSVFVIGDFRTQPIEEEGQKKVHPTWMIVPTSSLKGKALWVWFSIAPRAIEGSNGYFPQIRFERMFRRIE